MNTTYQLVQTAVTAAKAAETSFIAKHGEPWFCGFAWAEVFVDRVSSPEAKELIATGFKKSQKAKCLYFWNPGGSMTQSMDVKEEGTRAFVQVLKDAGLRAYACSRAD